MCACSEPRDSLHYLQYHDGEGDVQLHAVLLQMVLEAAVVVIAHRHISEHPVKLVGELIATGLLPTPVPHALSVWITNPTINPKVCVCVCVCVCWRGVL